MTILQQASAGLGIQRNAATPHRIPEDGLLAAAGWSALLASLPLGALAWPGREASDGLLLAAALSSAVAAVATLLARRAGAAAGRVALRAMAALASLTAAASCLIGVAAGWHAMAWLLPATAVHAALLFDRAAGDAVGAWQRARRSSSAG
jgi:hypothetical protein